MAQTGDMQHVRGLSRSLGITGASGMHAPASPTAAALAPAAPGVPPSAAEHVASAPPPEVSQAFSPLVSQATWHERIVRVRALLRSLDGWVPGPRSWCGQLGGIRGEGPSALRPCGRCGGAARSADGSPCSRCGGRGRLPVDGYTGRVLDGSEPAFVLAEEPPGRGRRGGGPADELGWERAHRVLRESGDYDGLVAALGRLRVMSPRFHGLVLSVFCGGVPRVVGPLDRVRVDAGLAFLACWLPGRIRVPGWALREERVRVAVEVLGWGGSAELAAVRSGLPLVEVRRLVRRRRQRERRLGVVS